MRARTPTQSYAEEELEGEGESDSDYSPTDGVNGNESDALFSP